MRGLCFAGYLIGWVKPSPKMFGDAEDRCVVPAQGCNETLDRQPLEDILRGRTGKPRDRPHVEWSNVR